MDEYSINKYMEFVIFLVYLILVFLSTQILFIWLELDKNKLKSKLSIGESFLKNDILVVFAVGSLFMIHEFFEEIDLKNSYLYFEFFELLGLICIVSLIYDRYCTLKPCAYRKPVHEILLEGRRSPEGKTGRFISLSRMNIQAKPVTVIIFGLLSLITAASVPISTLIFILVLMLLFVPPVLVLTSTIIGASIVSKESGLRYKT